MGCLGPPRIRQGRPLCCGVSTVMYLACACNLSGTHTGGSVVAPRHSLGYLYLPARGYLRKGMPHVPPQTEVKALEAPRTARSQQRSPTIAAQLTDPADGPRGRSDLVVAPRDRGYHCIGRAPSGLVHSTRGLAQGSTHRAGSQHPGAALSSPPTTWGALAVARAGWLGRVLAG